MANWRRSTWGDEISLEYGKGIRDYADASGPVRVFGTNGPVGWSDTPLADGPGVILGRKGAYRGVHYSPDPFFVIDTAYYAVAKTELDMRWLYYAMIHHELGKIDDGSPIPSTTRAAVYPRELEVPELAEQRDIAGVLASLDDKIEQNRRTASSLEELARAIFRAWFVDFEPVKSKAAGAASFPSMPQTVFDALPASLTTSAFGAIPQGWDVKPLDEIFVLQRGFDLPKRRRTEGPYPVLAASGPNGTHSEFKVRGPGVTTGRSGVLGKVFFVQEDYWPLNTTLWIKEYRRSNPWHAYFLLQTLDLAGFNAGSAVPTLNRNHLHTLVVASPTADVLSSFATIAKPFFELQGHFASESRKLAELRDYLLPKLLSGKVRVGESNA
ncbi:MAG: restriction endonuclease [Planctomycetaceae bacterium]|nr:restriction endonuclease [Planctomycetaceae bacterium]